MIQVSDHIAELNIKYAREIADQAKKKKDQHIASIYNGLHKFVNSPLFFEGNKHNL